MRRNNHDHQRCKTRHLTMMIFLDNTLLSNIVQTLKINLSFSITKTIRLPTEELRTEDLDHEGSKSSQTFASGLLVCGGLTVWLIIITGRKESRFMSTLYVNSGVKAVARMIWLSLNTILTLNLIEDQQRSSHKESRRQMKIENKKENL